MKSHLQFFAPVLASLVLATAGAILASAQITNPIGAHAHG
jgi:hypothetical protein